MQPLFGHYPQRFHGADAGSVPASSTRLQIEGEEGVDAEEELDLYMHDGTTLDLRPPVHDNVLLAFPVQPLCRPDCAGLCQVCGEIAMRCSVPCQETEGDPRFALLKQLQFS